MGLNEAHIHKGPHKVGFYAGGSQTRTEMQDNGLSASWVEGDEVALWAINSSGSSVLYNQTFKTYGIDDQLGYFTSELSSAMSEDTYTYYCCYPTPLSISGTDVTFSLPSVQDGKASSGADIMIATPVEHGALSKVPEPQDHSGLSLQMNRMMHQFRFWIPKGKSILGEDIERIVLTMPQNIVGTVTANYTDPNEVPNLTNASKSLTLHLKEPLSESEDLSSAEFACAAVYPYNYLYSSSDFMRVTVYTKTYKSVLDDISLSGRKFLAGHSTPVRLLINNKSEFFRLTLKTGTNNIGEPLWNILIKSGDQTLYTYANVDGTYHNIVHEAELLGSSGRATYESIVNAVNNGTAVAYLETNHALVDLPITSDMVEIDHNRMSLDLGDLPYLLYEDFTDAVASEHNDAYSGSTDSDTNVKGYLLNDYLMYDGWNAARYKIFEGDCVRINCRFESAVFAFARYCGRLDTPAVRYIKPGQSVNVVVEFDHAFYIPVGYEMDDSKNNIARFKVGYHTKSESSTINGVKSDDVSGNSTIVYTSPLYPSQQVSKMATTSVTIPSAGPSTRIVFYADTVQDEVRFWGSNSCYYLYLDNIKVYIKNN